MAMLQGRALPCTPSHATTQPCLAPLRQAQQCRSRDMAVAGPRSLAPASSSGLRAGVVLQAVSPEAASTSSSSASGDQSIPASNGQQGAYQMVACQPCGPDGGLTALPIDEKRVITKFIAETLLPTKHGNFRVRGYKHSIDGGLTFTEPTAIICGTVEGQEDVPVRVHDACFTSEVLGSLKCDCAEQLGLALDMIYKNPPGIVIYLQQEGRGIGLANKIAAYSLQESGLDTVDANRALGLPDDCREYTSVRNILQGLDVKSIKLITNNPRKINELKGLGLNVTGRVPCIVEAANEYNVGYLQAKQNRMDHLLEGQFCWWNHSGEPTQPTAAALARGGMGLPAGLKTREDGRVSLDSIDEEYAKSALPSPVSVASSTNSSSSSSASASSTS